MVNISGSVIGFIYAICMNTPPVAVLNGSLILINGIQLYKIMKEERKAAVPVNADRIAAYDIKENEKEETK